MINKYLKFNILTHCTLHGCGFSLFEVTLTLVISTIALVIAGSFVSSSVEIVTQTATESAAINTANTSSSGSGGGGNIIFTILDNDFANNLGGVSTGGGGNTLQFHILDPNNSTKTPNVHYNCQIDKGHQLLSRKVDGYDQENLLTNVTDCNFTFVVSSDKTTITLTSDITVTTNNTSVVLSNETTAQYTK